MMLYEGDVRRCRRCKRRRMDDEPPEVQQYKTCAKCRIIERTKKKSRKPLAEETMRYGMRQFQEQNQNSNFVHDDIFTNDQLINDMQSARDAGAVNPSKQSYNTQFSVYKQQPNASYNTLPDADGSNHNYLYANNAAYGPGSVRTNSATGDGSPAYQTQQLGQMPPNSVPFSGPTSSATAAAIAAAAIKRTDVSLGNPSSLSRSQNHYRQYQQKQQGDRSRITSATNCELCNDSLDADDSMTNVYRLCPTCYSDPYSKPNVFYDFNDFLMAVMTNKDADSIIFISELASYLVESLNNERSINSEEQFRKQLLESFASIYMNPLLGSLSPLKFTRASNNVSEVNNTAPIISKVSSQYHYTLTPPLKTSYITTTESGTTTIEMTFITETNLILIKLLTKKATPNYSTEFLKSLDEKMRAKGYTFEDDPTKIYPDLELSIQQEQFAKDFKSLSNQIADIRANEVKESNADENSIDVSFKQNGVENEDKQGKHTEIKSKDFSAVDHESVEQDEEPATENGEEAVEDKVQSQTKNEEASSEEHEDPEDLDPAFAP